MTSGLLEFVWQHLQVNEVQTIAIGRKALYNIMSPILDLDVDVRKLALFRRSRLLIVTCKTADTSHRWPKLEMVPRSARNLESEGWQDRIRTCSGSEVLIQSAKVVCSCTSGSQSHVIG
jgi:hypothetical protein